MRQLLDIDLRLLRIFRGIVEAQGLSGAQVLLNLSQSRISASLAELSRGWAQDCAGAVGLASPYGGRSKSVYEASHELFKSVDRFCNRAGSLALNLKRTLKLGWWTR